jgi:hypothetical protein
MLIEFGRTILLDTALVGGRNDQITVTDILQRCFYFAVGVAQ